MSPLQRGLLAALIAAGATVAYAQLAAAPPVVVASVFVLADNNAK